MAEVFEIIMSILRIWIMMCLWGVLFFWRNMSQYDKVYKTLNSRKWYINKEKKVILSSPLFTDDMILWLYERDSFSLTNNVLLFKSSTNYFISPYSVYWLWKYKKWFKENIDLSDVEEIKK